MLVCDMCGKVVGSDDLKYVTEMHGERHRDTRCKCGGHFIPATKCRVCGEWFDNTELYGVCEGCLDEHYSVGTALEIGDEPRELIGVNAFVAFVLTEDEINKILIKHVEEHYTDKCREVRHYLDDNLSCYSEWVEEKATK